MGAVGSTFKFGMAAMDVLDPYLSYRQRIKDGEGKGTALAKSAAEFVAWQAAPLPMFALMAKDLATVGMQMGAANGKRYADATSRAYKANFGGSYQLTENAYTMRQRGVQAIDNSRMNTRSVLGSEARFTGNRGNR